VFGAGPSESIEVSVSKTQLMFTRKGETQRPIHFLGDNTFYPTGALSVRIRIEGATLTVHDGESVVTAKKR